MRDLSRAAGQILDYFLKELFLDVNSHVVAGRYGFKVFMGIARIQQASVTSLEHEIGSRSNATLTASRKIVTYDIFRMGVQRNRTRCHRVDDRKLSIEVKDLFQNGPPHRVDERKVNIL